MTFQCWTFRFFFLKYYAIDAHGITTKTILQFLLFLSVFELEQETHISSQKSDICSRFCSLLSLIFCHNSGRCFSFLYFLYTCTGAGRLFSDRESVSWGFPNGPVKLFCSPSRWRFQKFWSFILPDCFSIPKKVAFEIFPRAVTVTGHFEKRTPAHIDPSGPTQVSFH